MTTAEPATTTYTNAPGQVIPIFEEEFEDFQSEATAFLDGDREEKQFIGFRLKQGVYGQRQVDRQMIRVKLPFGTVTADQLDALAVVAADYAPMGKGHITTRENFQFHHIPLARSVEALRLLGDVGLSTREACGNVVRNVTGDPWAGVRDDEPFDITPYAGAFVRYWVRNPLTQLLPRKFKVTFSGSDRDEALATIHDIGFIPRIEVVDGEEVRGFKLVTGGGLSTMAREGVVLREFVPVSDYLRVSEAMVRIFNAADELRKNIAKARMKFLVHKVGAEAWRQMVDDELTQAWAQRDEFDPTPLLFLDDEQADALPADATAPEVPEADRTAFEAWSRTAVRAQRQSGYVAIELAVPEGDLSPAQFRGVAEMTRTFAAGRARSTQGQNLVLRWVPQGQAYAVWQAALALGLGERAPGEIEDIVSCPGTDSCKLGITCSMGLNRAIGTRVTELAITDLRSRKIQINISGCPNSCGMHHLGNIGFHGAAIKAANNADRQVPSYNVFIGGSRRDGASLRLGQLLKLKIPSKRAPDVVERFVALYERERQDDEAFNDTFDRLGSRVFEDEIRDLSVAPDFAPTDVQEFMDWEREALYVLERGEGECAV